MKRHKVAVQVGDQVYVEDGGDEVGSVRFVEAHRLIVYIENARDFAIPAEAVAAVHAGKVILDPSQLDAEMQAAIASAHEREA